jgi:hypothetical protein
LTRSLFKVSQLDVEKNKRASSTASVVVPDEHSVLLSAKVIFRSTRRTNVSLDGCSSLGINLWSNNVPLHDGTVSFIARGDLPKKFTVHLAAMLMADDRVRLAFHMITTRKKRKKLVGVFELMLESLIEAKLLDLAEENLSDVNNYLLSATVRLKLFYRAPNLSRERNALDMSNESVSEDDHDDGRHGGHRHRYVDSKHQRAL